MAKIILVFTLLVACSSQKKVAGPEAKPLEVTRPLVEVALTLKKLLANTYPWQDFAYQNPIYVNAFKLEDKITPPLSEGVVYKMDEQTSCCAAIKRKSYWIVGLDKIFRLEHTGLQVIIEERKMKKLVVTKQQVKYATGFSMSENVVDLDKTWQLSSIDDELISQLSPLFN